MSHTRILSWRDLLRDLLNTPAKKQACAQMCTVSLRTIDRWISGTSDPQKQESIRILASLSEELKALLQEEWPEAFSPQTKTIPIESVRLPEEFVQRVLRSYSHTSEHAQRWTIFRLVSSQMLGHLDPEQLGLVIVYVRSENETIQLFETAGSALWRTRQVLSQYCEEPWIVEAVNAACPLFVQSLQDADVPPPPCFANAERIQSVGYFPLYRAGHVGGGILFASPQADFFTPVRQVLLEAYCHLLALAFRDTDFHEEIGKGSR